MDEQEPVDQGTPAQATFEVTTVAIGNYPAREYNIPAKDEASKVLDLLAKLGAREINQEELPDDCTLPVVNEILKGWARHDRAANTLLFWVGHGEANPDGAWLAVHETEIPMRGSGLKPEQLADHIVNQWMRRRANDGCWAAVIIEACGADSFVDLLDHALSKSPESCPKRLLLFGAGGRGQSYLGTFSDNLRKALDSFTDNDKEIMLYDLMGRVYGYFTTANLVTRGFFPVPSFSRVQVLPGGITATLEVYKELQQYLRGLPDDARGHFVPKAQGAEQGELTWFFTGRVGERQQICEWLQSTSSGLLIVTGRAGCGKSALLGNIIVYSNPGLRELLIRHCLIPDLNQQQRPRDNAFDVVVHVTGLTTAQFVIRLLSDLDSTPNGTTLNEWMDQLIALLSERQEPFTLLVDALDEAQEPIIIAGSILQRIASQPGCRVVVGTRRSTKEGPDQPDTSDENLMDALGRGENTHILEVPRDPAAMEKYVIRRLEAAKQQGKLPKFTSTEEIADLIQAQPGRQFLYARLAVHEILALPELGAPQNRPRLIELLGYDHRRLFAQAVDRLAAVNPVNESLLEALALAMGRGLPRSNRIWAIVAEAVSDKADATVSEQDIDNILQSAAPYIMLDGEDGQSVYRLAHRTFHEHFIRGPGRD